MCALDIIILGNEPELIVEQVDDRVGAVRQVGCCQGVGAAGVDRQRVPVLVKGLVEGVSFDVTVGLESMGLRYALVWFVQVAQEAGMVGGRGRLVETLRGADRCAGGYGQRTGDRCQRAISARPTSTKTANQLPGWLCIDRGVRGRERVPAWSTCFRVISGEPHQ